ncbi:MAG: hypothetical protein IPO00_09820 [Betaproteobacteria bacterium]|nr:hypothetical protein [Betaproteobacteria bacterium]
MRLNNAGTFELPATRAEVMYAPKTFGESPNVVWRCWNRENLAFDGQIGW